MQIILMKQNPSATGGSAKKGAGQIAQYYYGRNPYDRRR
jgi:hypothetical protein